MPERAIFPWVIFRPAEPLDETEPADEEELELELELELDVDEPDVFLDLSFSLFSTLEVFTSDIFANKLNSTKFTRVSRRRT